MPRIRCLYDGCIYLEGGHCTANSIELDPDGGCLTFAPIEDLALEDEDWEDELFDEDDELLEDEEDDIGYDPDEWN